MDAGPSSSSTTATTRSDVWKFLRKIPPGKAKCTLCVPVTTSTGEICTVDDTARVYMHVSNTFSVPPLQTVITNNGWLLMYVMKANPTQIRRFGLL